MCDLKMDCSGQIEERVREINTPKALFFKKILKRRLHDQPGVYDSFLSILTEYTYDRIDPDDMHQQVSRLFSAHPELIIGFCENFPQAMSAKDDNIKTPIPAKKAKVEDDSSKSIPVFDPTAIASTSYASDYTRSSCLSDCDPLEWQAVASCSSSSPSRPGNAAEAYASQIKNTARFIDKTLYVTETEVKLMDWTQAYEHLTELVKQIGANRIDTYSIMESASNLLQGYPDLIESFNGFLPEGFRIVILSDDHEMSTNNVRKPGGYRKILI